MTPINYQDNFHNVHFQNSLSSAKEIVPLLLSYYHPKSVLDVGCGLGTWLSVFQENSCEIYGIDGDYVRREDLIIDKKEFKDYDLNKKFDLEKKFDLVTSLEVAEHLFPENAKTFVDSLCLHGDIVLFSAAISGQEGTLHYNEQYNEYWVDLFAQNDYVCFDFLRHQIWNNKAISWWYRQNILIFIKKSECSNPIYKSLSLEINVFKNTYIHPELLEYKIVKAKRLEKTLNSPGKLMKYYLSKINLKFKRSLFSSNQNQ